MKFLSFIPKREVLKNKLRTTISRFPVASTISVAVTLLFFSLIAISFDDSVIEMLTRVLLSLIVTFFLSVGVTLYSESIKKSSLYTYLWHIACLLFGGAFYYFLSSNIDNIESITYFVLTLFGVISLLFSAPYLQYIPSKKFKEKGYYVYFYKIATVLFMACIVGGALSLGGSLAIMAVHVLFDIGYSISGDLYGYWISLSLALLTPFFALSELPKKGDFENSKFNENVFFNFLIRYIAIPFIYVYFFILYAYTIKVLLNFSDWPKGEVSWMVIGFSLFGYIIYIFSYIFESTKNSKTYTLIHLFRKYFPYIVIPQIAMLFYAISLRIGQYDLTMNRYFVVVFGLWLLLTSLYLIVSRRKSLLFIPTLLTLTTLIISVGPWSVYHLPLVRQTERLESNLTQAGILSQGQIIPLEKATDIDAELSSQIYDGIDYVCNFNNCNTLKELFPKIYGDLLVSDKTDFDARTGDYEYYSDNYDIQYSEPNVWEIKNHITNQLKVQRNWGYGSESNIYNIYSGEGYFPLSVSGYDYVVELNNSVQDDESISATADMDAGNITITFDEIQEIIATNSMLETLRNNYSENQMGNLSQEDRTFDFETESFEGVLIIQSTQIFKSSDYIPDEDSYDREYLNGILLIKQK